MTVDWESIIEGLETVEDALEDAIEHGGLISLIQLFKCEARIRKAIRVLKDREAEWIYGEHECGIDGWYCSKCRNFEPNIDVVRACDCCPHCGRKMKVTERSKPRKVEEIENVEESEQDD